MQTSNGGNVSTGLLARLQERVRSAEDEAATYRCRVCRDTGLFTGYLGQRGERVVQYDQPCPAPECEAGPRVRQEREQARLAELFAQTAIPPRFRTATLADFARKPSEWLAGVERARVEGRGLVLMGDYGTGKTRLAVAVLKERLAVRRSCLFVEVPSLLDIIRAAIREERSVEGGRSPEELLRAVCDVQVLVLDDLGKEKSSEWVREKLYHIVDQRYSWERETVCTTNLTWRELEHPNRLGEATCSRLHEMCVEVVMKGKDLRELPESQRGAR